MSDGVLLCGNRHGDDEYNDKRKRMMADKEKDGDSGRVVLDSKSISRRRALSLSGLSSCHSSLFLLGIYQRVCYNH